MYTVDSGAPLLMMGERSRTSQERETKRTPTNELGFQTGNGIVRCTSEARVYIHELATHVFVKLVDDAALVLSLGHVCDELGDSSFWQPRKIPY